MPASGVPTIFAALRASRMSRSSVVGDRSALNRSSWKIGAKVSNNSPKMSCCS
jgi:hypothetical protein